MNETEFWNNAKPNPETGCLEWQRAKDRNGYGWVRINGRFVSTHRLAWELTNGPIPKNMLVCHTCDNPACINPDHLFIGTVSDNTRDAYQKGRLPLVCNPERWPGSHAGSNNGRARLTELQVTEIRKLLAKKVPGEEIARLFDVTPSIVSKINRGKTWRNVF